MKQYILTVKFQVEDPENSLHFKQIKADIESKVAYKLLSFHDITTTEVKLEEDV